VDLINESDSFVAWALSALYWAQTEAEKHSKTTFQANSWGFSKANAPAFSKMAEHIADAGVLSEAQLAVCREPLRSGIPRLGKYRRQLLALVRAEVNGTMILGEIQ
jgi:hypothetical protein